MKTLAYNSRSITLKVNSEVSNNQWANTLVYSEAATKLKAEALTALLISANPLREEYNFSKDDYSDIADIRAEVAHLISKMENKLTQIKER